MEFLIELLKYAAVIAAWEMSRRWLWPKLFYRTIMTKIPVEKGNAGFTISAPRFSDVDLEELRAKVESNWMKAEAADSKTQE